MSAPSCAASAPPGPRIHSSIEALQRSFQPGAASRPAQALQLASVALGRAALGRALRRFGRDAALLGGMSARQQRGGGFLVEQRGLRRRAAPRSGLDEHRPVVEAGAQLDLVAHPGFARGLGDLAVDLDPALVDLVGRQAARLMKRAAQSHCRVGLFSAEGDAAAKLYLSAMAYCRAAWIQSWAASGNSTRASRPATRPCWMRLSSAMRPCSVSTRPWQIASPSPGTRAARGGVGRKGLEQAGALQLRDAWTLVADQQRRLLPVTSGRIVSLPPTGLCRTALCSRLRVSSRSIPLMGPHPRLAGLQLEVERLVGDQRRQVECHLTHRLRPVADRNVVLLAQLLDLGQGQHLVGEFGGPFHGLRDFLQRQPGPTSPRKADWTWVLSTASGVRSWCELSRTKRFWCSSSCDSLAMWRLALSISGAISCGARAASIGRRSFSVRPASSALSERTGCVTRCTTTTTTAAITSTSPAWRQSVSIRI